MRLFWGFLVVSVAGCASAPPASDASKIMTVDEYVSAITIHISKRYKRPKPFNDSLNCVVLISQDRDGVVQTVAVLECNGSEQEVKAIHRAIEKASPLPLPDSEELFHSDIRLIFCPRSNRKQPHIPCSDDE